MITSYVPVKSKIIDNRKPEGGYYTAICEVCGTEFFPQRSTARYCTGTCCVSAHRKAKAEGLSKGGVVTPTKKEKKEDKKEYTILRGNLAVYEYIEKTLNLSRGLKISIMSDLKKIQVMEMYEFKKLVFRKITTQKWKVY